MKQSCPYCGNNPVPHRLYWYNETLNILFTPVRQKILYNGLARFVKKKNWDAKLALAFLGVAEFLKIISRQNDIAKCKVRRAQVLWEEAQKRGIVMQELLLFGRPFDCYVAIKGQGTRDKGQAGQIVFSGLPRPAGYTNRWLDLMDDKWLFKKKLLENGLPVPAGASCSSFSQARGVFDRIQRENNSRWKIGMSENRNVGIQASDLSDLRSLASVIVKPRAGSRGRHSTTFVSSAGDLKRAFKIAKQLCCWIMVEHHLFGPVYRATLVNFELCGVLRGDPPQVLGDGIKTIADLIKQKNQAPHPGVKDIIIDSGTQLFLSRQGLTVLSVPKNAEMINLSEKIGVNYGGSSSEDFYICHPDNRELFVKAAKVLGDPLVGFDFIIPDIAKSYKQQNCGFIEVNSLPFINLHHDPLRGQSRNVAEKVWQMLGW